MGSVNTLPRPRTTPIKHNYRPNEVQFGQSKSMISMLTLFGILLLGAGKTQAQPNNLPSSPAPKVVAPMPEKKNVNVGDEWAYLPTHPKTFDMFTEQLNGHETFQKLRESVSAYESAKKKENYQNPELDRALARFAKLMDHAEAANIIRRDGALPVRFGLFLGGPPQVSPYEMSQLVGKIQHNLNQAIHDLPQEKRPAPLVHLINAGWHKNDPNDPNNLSEQMKDIRRDAFYYNWNLYISDVEGHVDKQKKDFKLTKDQATLLRGGCYEGMSKMLTAMNRVFVREHELNRLIKIPKPSDFDWGETGIPLVELVSWSKGINDVEYSDGLPRHVRFLSGGGHIHRMVREAEELRAKGVRLPWEQAVTP